MQKSHNRNFDFNVVKEIRLLSLENMKTSMILNVLIDIDDRIQYFTAIAPYLLPRL